MDFKPDRMLVKKTKVFAVLENQDKFSNLVKEREMLNPRLGLFPNTEHEIRLKTRGPITGKIFIVPCAMKPAVEKEIEALVETGVIQKSHSSFNATAFPILKKNGKLRLVIDYRALNFDTIHEISFIAPY